MALNIATKYPGKSAPATPAYPLGSARNITTPGDGTGTPLEESWLNDLFGFQQALINGSGLTPSGVPDTAETSQYLEAARIMLGAVAKSLAELSALTATVEGQRAFLSADGRSGEFVATLADISTPVTDDPLKGVYVPFDSDPTGASGGWVRQLVNGAATLRNFGADHTGAADASTEINNAHLLADSYGFKLVDDVVGTYLCNSTVRFRASFSGLAVAPDERTTFVKGPGALIVHYGQHRRYEDYICDANGEPTAFDAHYDGASTFAGGVKYSVATNIQCRNMTQRGFNMNQPCFGFTGINLRVAANKSDGSTDNVTAFYATIEDGEGVATPTADTNAAFTLITPNVYNRNDVANDVTFLQADYCRGVNVVGAEVAAARIVRGTQFDGTIQGAFEYINTHSTLFNSTLTIGGGSNIQTFREGEADWTGDTNIPSSGSVGRHIFRIDSETTIDLPNFSFFNQLGSNSGSPGVVSLVACASGFTGGVSVGHVHKFDLGGGGFQQLVQVGGEDGDLSKLTKIGFSESLSTFARDMLSADGIRELFPNGSTSTLRKPCRGATVLRELIARIEGDTLVTDVDVRVTTYDGAGAVVGAARTIVTLPSGSAAGFYAISIDPNRTVPDGGSYELDVVPAAGTMGSNTRIIAELRENYL